MSNDQSTYQCHCPDADCECCVACRAGKTVVNPDGKLRNYRNYCSSTCSTLAPIVKELEDLIDWPHVLAQPRYAGGHEEVMRSIFGSTSRVLAWWHDGDWQGTIAIAHRLADGRVVIMTDYYGSCSGCDVWENATDEDARKQVLDLVHSAKVFTSVAEAIAWCLNIDEKEKPQEYPFKDAVNLVEQLRAFND